MFPERLRLARRLWVSTRSTLAAAGTVLATLLQPLAPMATPGVALAQSADHSHWMADNAAGIGQRYLRQLIIPGSHDSGTYAGTNQPIAQAQDKSFLDQLNFGIRYLDLRVKYVTGRFHENLPDDYYFYHGAVNTSVKLTDLIDQMVEFYATPDNQKELTILDFSGTGSAIGDVGADGDQNDRLSQVCALFKAKLGPYLIDPTMVPKGLEIGQMTLNEIWSLPGTPRIISNWGVCAPSGYWPFHTFAGTYANMCYVEPYTLYSGIYSALGKALDERQANNVSNFYSLSVASTPTSDCFLPLYYLNITQRQQILALDRVKSWFDNNEHGARSKLNIIIGDYVANTSLVDYAIQMSQAGPRLFVDDSVNLPNTPLTVGQSVSFSCSTGTLTTNLEVAGQPAAMIRNPNDKVFVDVKTVANNEAHVQAATCTDDFGRVARVALPIAHASVATPVWVIDRNDRILYYDAAAANWIAVGGLAARIAVAPDGRPWVVNRVGEVWRMDAGSRGYRNGTWRRVAAAGTASDIAVGDEGSIWALAMNEDVAGARPILRFDGGSFIPRGAGAMRIAVGQDGRPWVVNYAWQVVRAVQSNTDWANTPNGWLRNYLTATWVNVRGQNGRLGSLAVGPWDNVFAIAGEGQGPLFQYDGANARWSQMGGDAAASDIAADARGLWAVNAAGQIWRYTSSANAWAYIDNDGMHAVEIGASTSRLNP